VEAVTVKKNGLKVCTAGVGLNGTMTVFIRWSTHGEKSDYAVSVMGIDGEKQRFLNWDVPGIAAGDEIAIKLDTATVDELKDCPQTEPSHHRLFPTLVLLALTVWTIAAQLLVAGSVNVFTWIFVALAAAAIFVNHRSQVLSAWSRFRHLLAARAARATAQ
jgi:hypothetical protein